MPAMPRNKQVDEWFARYDNPMKPVVQRMREIILAADSRIEECIKWQAPTFTFAGNLASFYPKSKQHASLMFHQGAQIPGRHPRLEGTGDVSRVMKLATVAEANQARSALEAIVRAWCAWKSDGGAAKTSRSAKVTSARSKRRAKTATKVRAKLKAVAGAKAKRRASVTRKIKGRAKVARAAKRRGK